MIYKATNRNAVKIAGRMRYIKKQILGQEILGSRRRPRKLSLGKRGSIAVLVALTAPVLCMAIALGVEVSGWSAVQQSQQRSADMAAIAGAQTYNSGSTAQVAATEAAYVAEINGGLGAAGPTALTCTPGATKTWCATTNTLSDNLVSVAMTAGVKNASSNAFKATIQTTVPLFFSAIALKGTGKTLKATAIAEITKVQNFDQPCLLTLGGDATGVVTAPDVILSGNANVTANNCTIRSDGKINLSGNAQINTLALYASGTISTSSNTTVTGTQYINQAQISDPFATWSPVQTALTNASCSGGISINATVNTILSPGCYAAITASSNAQITLNPGVYYVNGSINLSGNSSLTGSGVAIASTGTLSQSGNVMVSLTAPTSGTAAGIVYASTSTNSSHFSGNAASAFSGLIYYPNGLLTFSGNATDGSTGCAEVVASAVTLSGNANLAANCSSYGLPTYGSLPPKTSISLVQ